MITITLPRWLAVMIALLAIEYTIGIYPEARAGFFSFIEDIKRLL